MALQRKELDNLDVHTGMYTMPAISGPVEGSDHWPTFMRLLFWMQSRMDGQLKTRVLRIRSLRVA